MNTALAASTSGSSALIRSASVPRVILMPSAFLSGRNAHALRSNTAPCGTKQHACRSTSVRAQADSAPTPASLGLPIDLRGTMVVPRTSERPMRVAHV